jgi:hypothetical protein
MRRCRYSAGRAHAAEKSNDPNTADASFTQGGAKPSAVTSALEIECDDPDSWVLNDLGEIVSGVGDNSVAGADEIGDSDMHI